MRKILIFLAVCISLSARAQTDFSKYFTGKVLRFDYMFAGNSTTTTVYPLSMKEEPYYGGSETNLTDKLNLGNFRYELYDKAGGNLIFSRGFCTLFQEWQTTGEAKSINRSFYEVAALPYPKNPVHFVISIRQRSGEFATLYETDIDPSDYYIRKEKPTDVKVTKLFDGGNPATAVDLAFIAEGYTKDEMGKFREDVKKMATVLFAEEPYSSYKDKFNIWAVEAVSAESGTDIPGDRKYVSTALNSSFYTFGTDRYLTTQDIKAVNDYAASVPHDNIIVLINSSKYGGGGVYNYYSGTTVDNILSPKVFVHEFGHGFAGLADEYYSSSVAYDEFYPLNVEPWEPNITTLVNFDSKWKSRIAKDTPVPTPSEDRYNNVTGVFEGGGYSAKGIYRPEMDCRMKSNGNKGYCAVCRDAVKSVIETYIR